jgi:hypothetical protein
MHLQKIDSLKRSTVLVTLAAVQFASSQILLSTYASAVFLRVMRSAHAVTLLRSEPVRLRKS